MKLRLTLDVEYRLNGETEKDLADNLFQMVYDAMSHGTITGYSPAVVLKYSSIVDRMDKPRKKRTTKGNSLQVNAVREMLKREGVGA